MLPNRLILGWCLGVLVVSVGGAAVAMPSAIAPTEFLPAEFPSFESFAVTTSSPIPLVPPAMRVTQRASDRNNAMANIPNTANVSLQISPNQPVSVGTKISFRVTAKKPGYLVLVDIDANGHMSQIFPSLEMIVQSQEAADPQFGGQKTRL
jgi:hypothetical protein